MKLLLMGTGPFAVPSFQAILDHGYEIACVVTRPAVASATKKESPISPVRQWAMNSQLPIRDPVSINEPATLDWLRQYGADLMVVCDFGQILSRAALETTRLGGINLHGSLLPRHRGAAPVQWSILSGDHIAGVSVIHMTPILDGGPVLHQSQTQIVETENALQLEAKLSQIGVESTLASLGMLEAMESLEQCKTLGELQEKSLATKAPRLAKEDGELDFHYCVRHIDRLVRGLQPWPGTYSYVQFPDGKSIRVIIPEVCPITCDSEVLLQQNFKPGEAIYGESLQKLRFALPSCPNLSLCVVAKDGVIGIPTIQPAGKRLMSAQEFLRGHSRYPNMRLIAIQSEHRLLEQISQFP
jgi:methionyl-tRNA formyltransferase